MTTNTTGQTTETRKSQDVATLTRDMNSETNQVKKTKTDLFSLDCFRREFSRKSPNINWTPGSVTCNRPEAEAGGRGREAHVERIASREHARSKTRGSKEQAAWCQHLASPIGSLFSDKALSTKVEHSLSFHRLTYCSLQTMLQTYARALLATLTNLKHNKRPTIYSAYPKLKQSKTSWIPTRFWSRDFTKTTGLKSKHSGHEKKLKTQTIVTSHSRIFCLADVSNILFKLGYASLPSSPHLHISIFIFQEAAHLQSISVARKVRLHPMRSHSVKSRRDGPSPMLLAVGTRQK